MDNLQTAMGEAEWARREGERRPYRVLEPTAPEWGRRRIAWYMVTAFNLDRAGRDDLVQWALDKATVAAMRERV